MAYDVLLEELIKDPRAFARHLPPSKCRYLLDIPDLQDPDNSADDLARIENALAVVAAS